MYDKVVPEFIIVGLGYAGENLNVDDLRRWELSPAPFGGGGAEASGHAADFLRTIEAEIILFVEREYRADPSYRVLSGASLGGLFTPYSMYTKPELFQAYIAATPAVTVGNGWLFGYEEEFTKANRPLKARLFVSGGGNESPGFLAGILGATDKRAPQGFAPTAIGLALTLIHLISIPVTNTPVNPARSTGIALFVGGWAVAQLWLYWVAPIVGALAGGALYRGLFEPPAKP